MTIIRYDLPKSRYIRQIYTAIFATVFHRILDLKKGRISIQALFLCPELNNLQPMDKQKPKVDVINMVLEECIIAYPVSSFIISIYQQYQQRGWLTKKQLEGLHQKAASAKNHIIPAEKLAALEAIIKKMPNRQKSELPTSKPLVEKDEESAELINSILQKYPQHKRVLFLQAKFKKDQSLPQSEIQELKKFKTALRIE